MGVPVLGRFLCLRAPPIAPGPVARMMKSRMRWAIPARVVEHRHVPDVVQRS